MTKEEEKQIYIQLQKQILEHSPVLDLTHIQKISKDVINKHFEKYDDCENLWVCDKTLSISKLQDIFSKLRRINQQTRPNEYYLYYEDEVMVNNLSLGKVVEDMYFAYRIKTEYPKCPLCGSSIFPHTAALSRRNNKTYICRDCGQSEAVQDFANVRE